MSSQTETESLGKGVRIKDITKTFGSGIVACDDISIDIQPDEFVVLLGPSGCGKTTTLRSIAGLEEPDSGRVYIGDTDVTDEKPKDRNLAYVFQSIALFPHMSVRRNIGFGLDMQGNLSSDEKEQRVRDVAELLGIEEMLNRKPSELSGGQQQRVSLGRAMVMEPAAFLLDEPFSALDANLRDQMRVETKQLQRRLETAMVFVTHDQEEAMTLGDKVVVMNDGNIQQTGSPYEIYNDPANRFVAEFIGSPSTNFIPSTLRRSNGSDTIENDLFTFELTEAQSTQIDAADGATVSLGIRPEHMELGEDDRLFDAEITVVEPLGSQDAVYMSAEGHDLRALTPQNVYSNGTQVSTRIERDEFWLFDEAGARIL